LEARLEAAADEASWLRRQLGEREAEAAQQRAVNGQIMARKADVEWQLMSAMAALQASGLESSGHAAAGVSAAAAITTTTSSAAAGTTCATSPTRALSHDAMHPRPSTLAGSPVRAVVEPSKLSTIGTTSPTLAAAAAAAAAASAAATGGGGIDTAAGGAADTSKRIAAAGWENGDV
jgi:hypothetical protein